MTTCRIRILQSYKNLDMYSAHIGEKFEAIKTNIRVAKIKKYIRQITTSITNHIGSHVAIIDEVQAKNKREKHKHTGEHQAFGH